ncbi:MAG: isochorismatase family protein, partial [Planctomycetaceae bacterium]|nr:isochorismatase family protein [Planctomycetaceae bacterium]
MMALFGASVTNQADDFQLTLRSQSLRTGSTSEYQRAEKKVSWNPSETAIIVCDVWDRHHCLNAVRRMTEFLPRMDALLKEARAQGAVIIHSPSDCMPAYEGHPARLRALKVPVSAALPRDAAFWCSQIPSEEQALYPIDQSDGGEDDDPAEHKEWAAKLASEGRNPGLPWKAQNDAITIDAEKDYVSDRGDEVFNILEARGIRNVILVGVHTNMCVLGRPFGLRQMVRSGRNVVLARDLTDCMYNPARWPYVDHFTGNDLIVSHVERFVCPTITSDQILGGSPHVSKFDQRSQRDVMQVEVPRFSAKTAGS